MTDYLETPQGRRIAYNQRRAGQGPGVVFLPGLKSDMEGTKALFLEEWANTHDVPYLRFDYSGHGISSGSFTEGAIGDWHQDAVAVMDALTEGPQIVVGSSMGGWQALLLARARPARIAGLIGIAAAPDFTEDGYAASFTEAQWDEMARTGQVRLPSDYEEDYVITKRMIEDGKDHLVLRSPLLMPFPVRLMQGDADTAVPVDWALRLMSHATCDDLTLTLVKDADHRFSTPECLKILEDALAELHPAL